MSITVEVDNAAPQRQHVAGTLGLVVTIAVAVILGVHPFGSTGLYDDGARFVDHVGPFWVAIHVAGAVLLLAIPVVLAAWSETLQRAAAQVFGRLTVTASTVAVTLAALHLVGTDTMTFVAYRDTLASGIEGASAGADVLGATSRRHSHGVGADAVRRRAGRRRCGGCVRARLAAYRLRRPAATAGGGGPIEAGDDDDVQSDLSQSS